jgi:hypothetical protein
MYNPMKHNYMRKLMKLQQKGKLPNGVCLAELDIYHDDWCGIYRGDYCNCHPVVKLRKQPHLDPRRN